MMEVRSNNIGKSISIFICLATFSWAMSTGTNHLSSYSDISHMLAILMIVPFLFSKFGMNTVRFFKLDNVLKDKILSTGLNTSLFIICLVTIINLLTWLLNPVDPATIGPAMGNILTIFFFTILFYLFIIYPLMSDQIFVIPLIIVFWSLFFSFLIFYMLYDFAKV